MKVGKTLCISFSRQSTGEVRLWIAALSHAGLDVSTIEIMVDEGFHGLFTDYAGSLSYQKNPHRMSESIIAAKLLHVGSQYDRVVLLDLTSICLENRLPAAKATKILLALSALAKIGVEVALFDPMGVMEKDGPLYKERVQIVSAATDGFMETYNVKVGPNTNYRSYYFGRYLKERTLSQLILVPESIDIYRSVPYNDSALAVGDGIKHFDLRFESCDPIGSPDQKKILIALSGFAKNAADKKVLNDLLSYIINRLCRYCGFQRFVIIDPMEINLIVNEEIELRVFNRMSREEFLTEMRDVGLCSAFIPTSTVGITAIQNGIPFVSFFASEDSDQFIDHGDTDDFVPRFTSLGIWEDFAFFDHLKTHGKSYLNVVDMVDVSSDKSFRELCDRLSSGLMKEKAKDYCRISEDLKNATLADFLGN